MELRLNADCQSEACTITVIGEIDVSNASALRAKIDDLLALGSTREIVINLAEMPYIDSTGIGVLMGAAHRAREDKVVLAVEQVQKNILRVFEMLGVGDVLEIRA